ncbi:G-type lectin S-receptor-like serine/threonine-protein kinase At1g11330 [Linum perenne]
MAEIEKNKYGIGEGDEHDNTQLSFFSFKDVLTATDNFSESNKLGEGGFGPVYKGKLSGDQEVAMKRLSKKSGQGLEEFMNELKLIAKLQHTYLVRLLGCCVEREEKILIYEYMPNRSLDKFLFELICSYSCNCTAYSYLRNGCSIWSGDLFNLRTFQKDRYNQSIYMRIAGSEKPDDVRSSRKRRVIGAIIGSVVIGIMVSLLGLFLILRRNSRWEKAANMAEYDQNNTQLRAGYDQNNTQLSFFSFKAVLAATDNFSESNKLGEGGFGPVYKGKLSGNQEVAMKRLSKKSGQGLEEFMNELKLIAKLQHNYLVRLLGCCVEREEKILIYDGYMSPEYTYHGQFSEKSDVFSFGVLLLEIVSGKRNKDFYHPEIPSSLLCWVWELWKEGKPEELIDPAVKNTTCCNLTEAVKFIHVGLLCVQEAPIDRPTMASVTQMLSSNDSQSFTTPGELAFITRRAIPESSYQVPMNCSNNQITVSFPSGRL